MPNDKKAPAGAISFAHIPDALDLLKIERRIGLLEKEKAEIEAKSKLIPGRAQKLERINKELAQLGWTRVSIKEHVNANVHQSEIYEREAAVAKRDAAQQQELDERRRRELAAQGGPSYREALRAYAANWRKQVDLGPVPVKTKDSETEREPE